MLLFILYTLLLALDQTKVKEFFIAFIITLVATTALRMIYSKIKSAATTKEE